NTGMSVPIAFSFIRSESEAAFNFIFDCMQDMFWDNCLPPRVILSDQAKGFISSMATSMPTTTLQLCEWHAVSNIKTRLADSKGYTKARRDELNSFIWAYIQSMDMEALNTNRTALLAEILEPERKYLRENW